MKSLSVNLGERSYPIHIGVGLYNQVRLIPEDLLKGKAVVITNETIAPLYLNPVLAGLRAACSQFLPLALPGGASY